MTGGSKMSFRAQSTPRTFPIHCCTISQTKNAPHFIIQLLCSYFAFLYQCKIRMCQIVVIISIACPIGKSVCPTTELHIQAIMNSFFRVVGTSPVGNNHSVKSPFTFQDIIQQILVMTTVLTFIQVVRSHDGPSLPLPDSSLESRQINFIQSTVIHNNIGGMAVHFLIIQRIVFYASGNAILLYTLYIRNYHLSGQIRVFTHIFEITPVQRSTVNIHSGT